MSLKYFKREEFTCQVSGTNNMEREFLEKLDELREVCGFPFEVTSGLPSSNLAPYRKKKGRAGNTCPRDCG